jgi:hypothetical protein
VSSVQEFEEVFEALKEGGSVRVTLFRDDKFKEVNLSLKP